MFKIKKVKIKVKIRINKIKNNKIQNKAIKSTVFIFHNNRLFAFEKSNSVMYQNFIFEFGHPLNQKSFSIYFSFHISLSYG